MKNFLGFIFLTLSCLSSYSTEKTKTFLLNKNEYKHLESNNLLVREAIRNAFGESNKQNEYTIDIIKVDAWNSKVPEFKYYPDVITDKGRALLKSNVLSSEENIAIKLRVTVNIQKSVLNSEIKTFLDNQNAFVLNIIVVGDSRIFVAEAANKNIFFEMINEQSFVDKTIKNFFGENPMKLKYNLVFGTQKICFLKKILKPVCSEEFELNKSTYDTFSDKITSEEYSASYVLFDLKIMKEGSRFTQKMEESLIKEADGTEHIKFYFCIPKDNQRAKSGNDKLTDIEGKILSGDKSPLKDVSVYLKDGLNNVVSTQKTDINGYFKFDKLQGGLVYSVFIDKSCKEKLLFLTSNKDNAIGEFKKVKSGFEYKLLDADVNMMKVIAEEEPSGNFMTKIKGKMVVVTNQISPMKEQDVELRNSKNELLQTKKTDSEGNFEFTGINPSENYSFELPNYDGNKNEKVYMANSKNELITEFKRNDAGKFTYRVLPADIFYLSGTEDTDVAMTFNSQKKINQEDIIIRDFIYYDLNSYELSPQSISTLDKIVKIINENADYNVEISSHTDCRGESSDNLKLSQKRSESVMAYFVKNNVDPKRLKSIGMGETKPLNSCVDGKQCTEEEYKMNRRTEFKFYK